MSGDLLLAVSPGEVWAARVERGQLVELRIAREGGAARVGTIFLGRIVALKPDLAGGAGRDRRGAACVLERGGCGTQPALPD